ncbi:neurosecretory protein VGF [Erythrolamprus reginae]|uniref:neurosecretory protein VGF n=1 Tax=Erythrolamprus reginae TaxID=121349 RepID=UPI00396C558C
MLWPQPLQRGTRLLLLLLLLCLSQCHRPLAAPLPRGLEGQLGGAPGEPSQGWAAEAGPDAGELKGGREELFQDVDPRALAAVLLQALQEAPQEAPAGPGPRASEERVQSEARSSELLQPDSPEGWPSEQDGDRPPQVEEEAEDQPESALKERQRYTHRREGARPDGTLAELEAFQPLRLNVKRRAPPAREPWTGARKLRQQQHLEHQLLQRRYEELAESRRQAEEARRAAAEEERLADMASDLLLQYLLKDGEDGEGPREAQGSSEEEEEEEGGGRAASLLFGDGEDNVAEDKRSNETPEGEGEEEGEEIDPNTIDRLIELSSKLHLPADDVIDIINHVEKKEEGEPSNKGKGLAAPTHSKPKKAPSHPSARQEARPAHPKAFPPYHPLPKQEEAAWNEVLKGDEFPLPKRLQAKDRSAKISNHIDPRTFQTPAYHHYRPLPGPLVPREGYYDIQAQDDDLENYLGSYLLLKHPKVF